MVGQTEHELTKNNIPYEYGIARYSEIAKGMMIGDETGGMLKILFHQETRKVKITHMSHMISPIAARHLSHFRS